MDGNSIRDNIKDVIKAELDRWMDEDDANEYKCILADNIFDSLGINEFEQDYTADESNIRVFNKDVICNSWRTEDVLSRALERDIPFTYEQAQRALGLMNRKFDAEYGINWTVIDCFIDEVIIEDD